MAGATAAAPVAKSGASDKKPSSPTAQSQAGSTRSSQADGKQFAGAVRNKNATGTKPSQPAQAEQQVHQSAGAPQPDGGNRVGQTAPGAESTRMTSRAGGPPAQPSPSSPGNAPRPPTPGTPQNPNAPEAANVVRESAQSLLHDGTGLNQSVQGSKLNDIISQAGNSVSPQGLRQGTIGQPQQTYTDAANWAKSVVPPAGGAYPNLTGHLSLAQAVDRQMDWSNQRQTSALSSPDDRVTKEGFQRDIDALNQAAAAPLGSDPQAQSLRGGDISRAGSRLGNDLRTELQRIYGQGSTAQTSEILQAGGKVSDFKRDFGATVSPAAREEFLTSADWGAGTWAQN